MGTIRYVRSVAIPVCSQRLAEVVISLVYFEGLCGDSSASEIWDESFGLILVHSRIEDVKGRGKKE